MRELQDAGQHVTAAGQAAGVYDLDRIAEEAEAASRDAREAADYLELAEPWPPGEPLVASLQSALRLLQQGMNLAELGASSGNMSILTEAIGPIQSFSPALNMVTADLLALNAATGFNCG